MDLQNEDLISIIVPVYNSEKYVLQTIQSIQAQTYSNWELILVDDCSEDRSLEMINGIKDTRIRCIALKENRGPAFARNVGIEYATGRYLSFIDADDLWDKDKLKLQHEFMKSNNYSFTYTGYEFADETGIPLGKVVHVPSYMTYKKALKNTTISTITVMFDMNQLEKETVKMPLNAAREDSATWWKVLKTGVVAYGIDQSLSYYRRYHTSSSANKVKAIRGTYTMYRDVEQFSVLRSIYYFCWYLWNAVRRRL